MKLKAIAIITAIILIVSYVPVYADTVIPDPPSDAWEYWVIVTEKVTGNIYFWCSHNPITVRQDGSSYPMILYSEKYYRLDNGNWVFIYESNSGQTIRNFDTMYASNHDIAYEDGSGFFFVRPKVSPLSQGMKATDFGTILRNFSVGLIPIIGCLILVISLRKGWEFLRTQLTH